MKVTIDENLHKIINHILFFFSEINIYIRISIILSRFILIEK